MTIFNTVIGGGSGDEVEAYAVGDAKNAVAGDKVSLNFSADAAPGRETASIGNYYLTAQGNGTCYFDGEFLYATAGTASPVYSNNCYIFRRQEDGSFIKWAGDLTNRLNAYPVTLRGLTYGSSGYLYQLVGGQSIEFTYTVSWPALSFSPDGKLLRFGSSLYLRNTEGLYVDTGSTGMGDTILFESEDGIEYPIIRFETRDLSTYTYNVSDNTIRKVGTRSGFFTRNTYTRVSVDLGGGYLIYSEFDSQSRNPASVSILKFGRYLKQEDGTYTLEEDKLATGNLQTALLKELSFNYGASVFWMEVLNDVLYVAADPEGDYDGAIFRVKVLRFKVNKEAGTFEKIPSPFLDKTNPDVISFSEKGYVAKAASGNYAQEVLITSLAAPVEQPYVATEPLQNQFYHNQTLTGIVQENDNGILKVSTVEDPNNPPSAIPDEAGLGVTPYYGTSKKLVNGEVVGSLTVSNDASVSGFTSSDSNLVYTDNPFLQILEGSEPVINTFEIVIPFTKGSSNDDILWELSNSISSRSGPYFYLSTGNTLYFRSNALSLTLGGTTVLTSNTKYWVKFAYDETEGYKILLSTNGSDYTVEASSSTTTELNVNYQYLIFGNNLNTTSSSYNWSGTIHFDGAYVNINGRQFWKGSKPDFGSVGVGYGYFRNTLSMPTDKYVAYEGGLLTEDNVFGGKATEMNVVIGRSAAGGSWTSDTKGYITAQDEAVVGANKKLSTPIYLWHDLSRITPAKPETIEAEIVNGTGYNANGTVIGTLSGVHSNVSADDLVMTGFSDDNYLQLSQNFFKNASTSFEAVVCFDSSDLTVENAALLDSPTTQTIRFTITQTGLLYFRVYTSSTSTATYTLTGTTTLSANTKYWAKITYSSSTGYELLLSTDGVSYTSEATNTNKTRPYSSATGALRMGDNQATGLSLPGNIYLKECYININGSRVWDGVAYNSGTVSLPIAWKTLDGVVYEYPNGYSSSAADISTNTVEGSNSLYVTKTGGTCGMAISSSSPAGVDSSAVIGTVELDASGSITSYTPGE